MSNIEQVQAAFAKQYPGVNPFGIYCQFTGKRVGATMDEELESLIDSLSGDAESIADDIAMRLFASMRPSMRWNKMRVESLDELRKSAPIDTLAYLLNRLFTPKDWRGDTLALQHDRIRLHNKLSTLELDDSNFLDDVLYIMIEIDAKLGLNTLTAPFKCEDFLDNFESWALLYEMISAWHDKQMQEYVRLEKRREMETRWFRDGNTLAKRAHLSMFMDSKPPSKKAVAEAEKRKQQSFMGGLLAEILNESTPETVEAVKPAPIPRNGLRGIRFGRKQES